MFIIMLVVAVQGIAQNTIESKMNSLQMMVGEWEGGGWYSDPSGKRSEFTQKEMISSELGGTAILIKGKGFIGERIIHDAIGVVRFDSLANKYAMFTLLADGKSTDATLEVVDDNNIEWWFEVPGRGTIKYFIEIKDGTWTEKGAFSPDKQNWYPFIQFTLKKV